MEERPSISYLLSQSFDAHEWPHERYRRFDCADSLVPLRAALTPRQGRPWRRLIPGLPAPLGRRLGVLQPLFSIRTSRGWGVGEIGDLGRFARWAGGVGLQVVQLLPVNELTAGESSPYSAATAFALDPVYLSLDDVEDFVAAGGHGPA